MTDSVTCRACSPADVRLLVLDVDGVLTDGRIRLDDAGLETKVFHVRDGAGIRAWTRLGHHVAIITGRSSRALAHRARELGLTHVHQGVERKDVQLAATLAELDLRPDQTAVMGDDLPDLPMLRRCGYPMAVADAAGEVRAAATFVSTRPGGHAAVREAIEHLLRAQQRWHEAVALFDPDAPAP